jgi:uncharacterized protein YbjT (DUF2867 family)
MQFRRPIGRHQPPPSSEIQMRILVTTPTGHIGSRIVEHLLESEHAVTVLARDAAKLSAAVRSNATVVSGSLDDASALGLGLAGTDAAFLLVPPPGPSVTHWRNWQEEVGVRFAEAAAKAHVSRIVLLSSTGAQHADIGPVSGLGVIEKQLTERFANVAIVRAGYFMENYFNSLATIASQGAIYGVTAGDRSFALVATRDIGDVAARWLGDATWTGHHIVGSHGPTPLTENDAAKILGEVLGRPIQYVQIPAPAMRDALLAAGVPPLVADGYEELFGGIARHIDAGDFAAEPFSAENAGTTTLQIFAEQVLRPAFERQFAAQA